LGLDIAKIKENEESLGDAYDFALMKSKSKLQVKEDRHYFVGKNTGNFILGFGFGSDDGKVTEIKDDPARDEKIIQALDKIGVKDIDRLSTFFQYVNNR
jgi:hypothetical protein